LALSVGKRRNVVTRGYSFGPNPTRCRQASEGPGRRGGPRGLTTMEGGVRPEELRREIKRLEDERLRLAPEVMGGDPAAVAKDRRLEGRIRELAGSERGHHPDGAIEPEGRDDPGGAL
jgi:hypothetical protein